MASKGRQDCCIQTTDVGISKCLIDSDDGEPKPLMAEDSRRGGMTQSSYVPETVVNIDLIICEFIGTTAFSCGA
jgi:hypothetical protein